jgi:hypothetical protein
MKPTHFHQRLGKLECILHPYFLRDGFLRQINYDLIERAQILILSPLLLIYVKQFDDCSYTSYRRKLVNFTCN